MTDDFNYDPLEKEEPNFARLIAEEWADDVFDPDQDIYTEEDGQPIEPTDVPVRDAWARYLEEISSLVTTRIEYGFATLTEKGKGLVRHL